MPTKSSYTFDEVFSETASVRVYGNRLDPTLTLSASSERTVGVPGSALQFVLIKGFGVGASYCKRLPIPIFLALPGDGKAPEGTDTCAKPGELVWSVPFSATSSMLIPESGTIETLLQSAQTRGIDGGLNLSNPR